VESQLAVGFDTEPVAFFVHRAVVPAT